MLYLARRYPYPLQHTSSKNATNSECKAAKEDIDAIRDVLWHRYNVFSNYRRNKVKLCFMDQRKIDDNACFNDKAKTGSLIPCLNGCYDLQTRQFRSTRPDDYLTRYCPVRFDLNADDGNVSNFIAQITQNDPGVEKFLRQIIGVGMDANIITKTMPQLYGATTDNGKTTFIKAIKAMLGAFDLDGHGLCCEVNPSAFELGKFGSERLTPKLATIEDSRIVFVSEPNREIHVNVGLLKSLTSGGTFQYEDKFQKPGSEETGFTIIWETNHLIPINDPTMFMRGTLQVVPFNFRVKKPDPEINAKLSTDLARSTWLNWIIKGHHEYVDAGQFDVPPVCKNLLASYESGERDIIQTFLDEHFPKSQDKKQTIPCREVFSEFKDWCEQNNIRMPVKLERDFKKAAAAFRTIEKKNNVDCFIGTTQKQTVQSTLLGKDTLNWFWSHEMMQTGQPGGNVSISSALAAYNQVLVGHGRRPVDEGTFLTQVKGRGVQLGFADGDFVAIGWRFKTNEEKAAQMRLEQEAQWQAGLEELEGICKKVSDPDISSLLHKLIAKLSAPEAMAADADVLYLGMQKMCSALNELSHLRNVA